MDPETTYLLNEDKTINRKFNFDHCFWSFNQFTKEKDGYYSPKGSNSQYSDQK